MKRFQCFHLLLWMTVMVLFSSFDRGEIIEKTGKSRLLIFIGSDWCPNCRRLERKILSDSVFISFARNSLFIEFADFPQHKKLEKSIVEKNKGLAEKYHFKGIFPTILLLDSTGNIRTEILYRNQSSSEFIDQLKLILEL